jgi:hypothetical protein
MATWTDEERREYMREYMRMWRVTSPKYKMCKLRQSRAHKHKYDNDPVYREELLRKNREYKAKIREQRRCQNVA